MIAAQLDQNNIVINRIVVDSLQALPDLVPGDGSVIGATYDPQTQTFTPPAITQDVPQVVSMAAGRISLSRAGVLSAVEAQIALIDGEASIWWNTEDKIKRSFPLVESIRVSMGWDNDYVDQLFVNAKNIENGN